MKIPKFRHLAAEVLESAGQMRLPGVDTLRALIQPIVALVQAAKKALGLKKASPAPHIIESERSITVRLRGALLTLTGDERMFHDNDSILAAVSCCATDTDVMDVLEGMGFSYRKVGAVKISAIDENLLENSNSDFAFV